MAKPIADLRDYNGTYYGASGTGNIGYVNGTLYRDNQDGAPPRAATARGAAATQAWTFLSRAGHQSTQR